MNHSPEPWRIDDGDVERPLAGSSVYGPCCVLDANGVGVIPGTPWIPSGFDMERIVACVNALKDIEDPVAFMAEVKDIIHAYHGSPLVRDATGRKIAARMLEHVIVEVNT